MKSILVVLLFHTTLLPIFENICKNIGNMMFTQDDAYKTLKVYRGKVYKVWSSINK